MHRRSRTPRNFGSPVGLRRQGLQLRAHAPRFIVAFPAYFNDLETDLETEKVEPKNHAGIIPDAVTLSINPKEEILSASPITPDTDIVEETEMGLKMKDDESLVELGKLAESFEATLKEPTMGNDMKKEQLLTEFTSLTETFKEVQSSIDLKSQLYSETLKEYEDKIARLEEKNGSQTEQIKAYAIALERQEQQHLMQHEEMKLKSLNEEMKQDVTMDEETLCMQEELFKALDKVRSLERENENFRLRMRVLEVELSDIAFKSRKSMANASMKTGEDDTATEATEATSELSTYNVDADSIASENSSASLIIKLPRLIQPKAPNGPIPKHVQQQHKLDQLQSKLESYEEERSSARKLFLLCVQTGMHKVGRVLLFWRREKNAV